MRKVFNVLLMLSVVIVILGGCSKSSNQKSIQNKGASHKKETKEKKETETIKATKAPEEVEPIQEVAVTKKEETKEKEVKEKQETVTVETKKMEKKVASISGAKTNYKALNSKVNIYLEGIGVLDVPFEDIIFNSDDRYYTKKELTTLSKEVVSVFRNEIYARHGYVFKDQGWNDFFKQYTWYKAGEFDKSKLNKFEEENIERAIQVEKELGYR